LSVATAAATVVDVGRGGYLLGYVDETGWLRNEPLSTGWAVAFEDVGPVREFCWSRSQRHWPGWWWSSTSDRHVGYESWLERDHAMLLDFDPAVMGFASQPFWLQWPGDMRRRRHAPYFFARLADGTAVVIDVRADERIEPADAEAFDATARACAQVGWQFRRVGTPDLVRVANVRWLSRYRHPRCGARIEVVERLLEVFDQPAGLFEGAAAAGDRLAVLPVLYHLMWRHVLVAGLEGEPLHAGTVVRRGGGGR
jgi:hypothetical protein